MAARVEVEVASASYRIFHHVNLALFTILAVTGGALLFSEFTWWLMAAVGAPLAGVLGLDPVAAGGMLFRTSHRFLSHVWGAVLIVYAIYLLAFRRVEVFKPLKKPLKMQIREAKALAAKYLLGREIPSDVASNLDRHNVMVAYMSLVLLIGLALLSISGVALVYQDVLGLTPTQAMLMLLLHDVGFVLSLLFVALHLFAVLHPANRPLLLAMFGSGKVDAKWAEKHMFKYVNKRAQPPVNKSIRVVE